MRTFLDSSFAAALVLADDNKHAAASQYWTSLVEEAPEITTTSLVVCEVVALLNGRGLHRRAVAAGNDLMSNPAIEFIFVDRTLFDEGWEFFHRHADKTYSLADCVSFVLMKQRGISAALTFDKHFAQAGFTMVPQ